MSLPSFEDFFRAIHGYSPFPWQCRAAEQLANRETFAVAVPTGLGKSSLVDAAVWAAVVHGTWRRIAFVIDRRLVVDEVFERAEKIKHQLRSAKDAALQAFQARLGELQVVRLRGGVFGDDDWVLYPERISIILTTVDQLGSRLLFRGYGVSPKRWPMHAGFLSDDALIVVDEAHLSNPLLDTLDTLKASGADISLIPMSATLHGARAEARLVLSERDHALAIVQQRLTASKQAALVEVGSSEKDFTKEVLRRLGEIQGEGAARKIAVVVNRVATARAIFEQLRTNQYPSTLLTGRVRPFDRDQLLGDVLDEVKAGRIRDTSDRMFVVVATQTIEVGADFDFDALITECAPLSALRQRFGRLDRLGELGQSRGWILRRTGQRPDPVYREASAEAWEWLRAKASSSTDMVDFGLNSFADLLDETTPMEPVRHAAALLPSHIDLLSQTGPYAPHADLAAWLHGPSDQSPDVTLVWRDDLTALAADQWAAAVTALPPLLGEGLPLPLHEARAFLRGMKATGNLSDLNTGDAEEKSGSAAAKAAVRWRGIDDCAIVSPEDIRPGDTLVLPSNYGGCDPWGWAPESRTTVADIADSCQLKRHLAGTSRSYALRLVQGHQPELGSEGQTIWALAETIRTLQNTLERDGSDFEVLEEQLAEAQRALLATLDRLPVPLPSVLKRAVIASHPGGLVVRGQGVEEVEDIIETGQAISLTRHHEDVARWADRLCQSHPQTQAIVSAAIVHDAGKADARMQALLHGHPVKAANGPTLAKSALRTREQQLAAYRASRLPKNFRHEFASLDYAQLEDPLVRHLVATHHGHGRPWLKPCADPQAAGARFASLAGHWPEHWSRMMHDHGPWRLAALEWRLRAADARASIEEAQQPEGSPL
jgi:CRISPR-associated endonuclease/helicase Cas3